MQRTQKQVDASRRNGALSHGPTTPEGKLRSSLNSFTHGLDAAYPITLTAESKEAFADLRRRYHNHFAPATIVESQLVDELASIQWRRQRGEIVEAASLDNAMDRMEPEVSRSYSSLDAPTRIALAYRSMDESSRSLHHIQIQIHRLSRHYLRLLAALRAEQKNRGNEPNVSQPAHHQQDPDYACNGNPPLTHS